MMAMRLTTVFSLTLMFTMIGCESSGESAKPEAASSVSAAANLPKDIFEAAAKGTVGDIRSFLSQGADIDAKDKNGNTPLHLAARDNPNDDVLRYLIEKGADVNAKNKANKTPFQIASTESKETILRDAGGVLSPTPPVPAPPIPPVSPQPSVVVPSPFKNLLEAAEQGYLDDIRYFVEVKKASVNERTPENMTPLHFVILRNFDVDAVKYLVEKGAKVNAKTDDFAITGVTPLHLAVTSNSNIDVLKYLIAQGADVNAEAIQGVASLFSQMAGEAPPPGITPFDMARNLNHQEKMNILRKAGDRQRRTQLSEQSVPPRFVLLRFISGAGLDSVDDVRIVIENGIVDVNATDSIGRTALHSAAEYSNLDVLKYLIEKGADVNAENDEGATPLDVAKLAGFEEGEVILRKAGGRQGNYQPSEPEPISDSTYLLLDLDVIFAK